MCPRTKQKEEEEGKRMEIPKCMQSVEEGWKIYKADIHHPSFIHTANGIARASHVSMCNPKI